MSSYVTSVLFPFGLGKKGGKENKWCLSLHEKKTLIKIQLAYIQWLTLHIKVQMYSNSSFHKYFACNSRLLQICSTQLATCIEFKCVSVKHYVWNTELADGKGIRNKHILFFFWKFRYCWGAADMFITQFRSYLLSVIRLAYMYKYLWLNHTILSARNHFYCTQINRYFRTWVLFFC